MKRTAILITAIAIAMFNSTMAVAVEKKEKKAEDKKEVASDATNQKKAVTSSSTIKKYDDFIDLNKNGKDDRYENLKPKKKADTVKQMAPIQPAKKPAVSTLKSEPKKEEPKEKKPK